MKIAVTGVYQNNSDRDRSIVFMRQILGITICVLSMVFFVRITHAEDITAVSITNERPVVGEQLEVSIENSSEDVSYSYIWTIDNQEIDCQNPYYVPTVDDYEHWIEVKVYNGAALVGSDKIYFSKLPVVYIHTEDGEAITSRTDYKAGDMLIQGNAEYGQEYSGKIQIKGRGNGSWQNNPKKPYKIKLDVSMDLFGFGKNKHWVLLANYQDESLLRNTIANEISTKMGLVGMDTTWVDVVLNDVYVGNYQFCEQIRVGKSRVNIFNWDDEAENVAKAIYKVEKGNGLTKGDCDAIEDLLTEDYSWINTGTITYNGVGYNIPDYYDYNRDISGGYLLELNAYNAYLDGDRDKSEFETDIGMRVVVDTPEYAVTNDAMMNYIKEYMQDYEDAYSAVDGYNSKGLHYTQMADFDSMICFWLTQEICGNNDAMYRSRWLYKDIAKPLIFGPVWDFDYGFGVANPDIGSEATGWKLTTIGIEHNLFKNWIDDPYFTIKAQEQYWSIRPYLQTIVDDNGMIDQYNVYLKESGAANESAWKWDIGRGYQGDTDAVKTYLKERLAWLDEQFVSQESIMKSLYTHTSANPYTKSDDKLAITLDNVAADTISANVPADGVISAADNLACTVAVNDGDTKKLEVYVNGLKLNESAYIFDVIDGQCSFEVPESALTQKVGSKNVISLIGRDIDGAVTCTNFASVIAEDDGKDAAAFDYPSGTPNAALETDLENYTYPATGGALAEGSTLSASINGTDKLQLIYSKDEYTDEWGAKVHVPVMAASETNPWGENACYEIKCSTEGYENVSFSASLGATKKGPRDFKLQYSLDGENYIDVEGSERSLTNNKEMQKLYSSFELPEECANREILYIRVVIASDVMVNGSEGLAGAAGGEAAINHICVQRGEPNYTITFESNGGSAIKAIRGKTGMAVEEPEKPSKTGYTFAGWYSDEALTKKYEFTTMPAEDITLYAKWDDMHATEPPGTSQPSENTTEQSSAQTKLTVSATYKKPVKNQKAKLQTVANVKKITLYTKGIKTAQLSAKIAGSSVVPKWSSSNRKVVTVSKKGKITAKKKGTAYITAKIENTTVQCKVVVKQAKLKVNSPKKGINLTPGETYKLKVTVSPLGKIKYISSNKKVVKVAKDGKLKAVASGKATITITSNGMKKKIKVLVE